MTLASACVPAVLWAVPAQVLSARVQQCTMRAVTILGTG